MRLPSICLPAVCALMPLMAPAQDYGRQPVNNPARISLFEELPIGRRDIVMLGNSITNYGMWEELFDDKHVKNRGVGADKTHDVLRRLDPIIEGRPRKVFILIGVNDLPGSFDPAPEQVAGRIMEIAGRIAAGSPRTKVYVQSIMPVNDTFRDYASRQAGKGAEILRTNALLRQMCGGAGVTYIDLHPALADERGKLRREFTHDGLHLTGAGYVAWRDALKPYIRRR